MTTLAKTLRALLARAGALLAAALASVALTGAADVARAASWHGDYFPNVVLTTAEGKQVKFYDDLIKDRLVVVQFFFTSCKDVCPAETAQMRLVADLLKDRMGKDIFFYSITIDPTTDTPAVLKAYSQRYKTGPGWTYLTGSKEDVSTLQRKFGLLSGDLKSLNEHSTSIMFGNEKTARWQKRSPYDSPEVLANLIGFTMKGATGPRISSAGSYENAKMIGEVSPGAFVFRARCASCHRIGGGDDLGPDLAGVTHRRDRLWLTRWIKEPDKMIAEKDPTALALLAKYNNLKMPNLSLGDVEADAILKYLDDETAKLAAGGAVKSGGK